VTAKRTPWHYAVMMQDMSPFVKGEAIVVGKSTLEFTHPGIGEGYWILSTSSVKCLLVADGHPMMGKKLHSLIRWKDPVQEEKQDRCTERVKTLMADSVYAPRNRKRMTYFFGNRPERNKSTEWKYD
jgi:hypothetical protein